MTPAAIAFLLSETAIGIYQPFDPLLAELLAKPFMSWPLQSVTTLIICSALILGARGKHPLGAGISSTAPIVEDASV